MLYPGGIRFTLNILLFISYVHYSCFEDKSMGMEGDGYDHLSGLSSDLTNCIG